MKNPRLRLTSYIQVGEKYPCLQKKIEQFYKDEKLVLKQDFYQNEFIVLKDEAGSSKSALTKYSGRKKALTPIFHQNAMPWGLKPLNIEQKIAIEVLLCNDINLVMLTGLS
jgi:PhoH-like ATPase